MTTTAMTWQRMRPSRGALSRVGPGDPDVWAERLTFDRDRAAQNQSSDLVAITDVVEQRARAAGAEAMVLSGSTARGRRTRVSDLDFHVIGVPFLNVADLPADIDLYAEEVDRFAEKIRSGDDFAHWSVWYGCVLFDSGVIQDAAAFVADHDSWPDTERKLRQARHALDFAGQIIDSGDYGAALEQARGALSLTARWVLLSSDVFPLARDEMPGQLDWLGQARLARDLRRAIRERPSTDDLGAAVSHAQAMTSTGESGKGRAAA